MGEVHSVDRVVIRFAGDSGDGMQLTGDRFTSDTARLGNDFSTLPNFPAEIRAPQGTVAGVSSFQVHFADFDIRTPGDRPDVLVAMNPAALKANLHDLPRGAVILADTADFTTRNLECMRDYGIILDDLSAIADISACFAADWRRAGFNPAPDTPLVWSKGNSRHLFARFIDRAKSSLYLQHPKFVDATILDRLVHNAHTIHLKGESMRKKKANLT